MSLIKPCEMEILERYRHGDILRSYAYTLLAAHGTSYNRRDALLSAIDDGIELDEFTIWLYVWRFLVNRAKGKIERELDV